MDEYHKEYFKTERWLEYKRNWTRKKRAELRGELYSPKLSKELDRDLSKLRAELKQMRQEMKIKYDQQTIFLEDNGLIVGCHSPYYSKMLFHPISDNGREMAMRKFI